MQRAWRVLTGPLAPVKAQRAFAGAAISRLTASFASSSLALNADLDNNLSVLRARGRSLAQNHEYGRRFLTLVANNIVGHCGPRLQVRATQDSNSTKLDTTANSLIETHYERWGCVADVRGQAGLAQMLRIAGHTRASGLQGRVAVSHAYALGEVPLARALQVGEALVGAGS
jgi:capsid protein